MRNKVIFICPEFNGTQDRILTSLEKKYKVKSYFYSEHDVFNIHGFKKLILRVINVLMSLFSCQFLFSIREKIILKSNSITIESVEKFDADYILIVKGFGITNAMLVRLKSYNPRAKFVFYQWDSFEIYSSTTKIIPFFDYVYTFQKEDEKFGATFIPNCHFELNKSTQRSEVNCLENKNGIAYVGRFSIYRYIILKKVRKHCNDNNIPYKLLLVTSSPLLANLDFSSDLTLDKCEVLQIYRDYGVVLDLGQNNQTGLTQRFFEGLALGCFVITSSTDFNYLDGLKSAVISLDGFFNGEYFDFSKAHLSQVDQYFVDNWLEILLEGKNNG